MVDDYHSTDREVGSVAILIDRRHGRGVTMERHTTTFFVSILTSAEWVDFLILILLIILIEELPGRIKSTIRIRSGNAEKQPLWPDHFSVLIEQSVMKRIDVSICLTELFNLGFDLRFKVGGNAGNHL